jgi:glycerophosphoryl diester phosphodiesterase
MKKLLVFVFLIPLFSALQAQVKNIAHRGASSYAPENTIASEELAWKLGADAVELDIYLSKDKKVVVIHDGNTKRTSGESYLVKDTKSKVLRKLDNGSFKDIKYKGEKIPFLKEMIAKLQDGKELVIEIKCGSEVLPYLKKVVKSGGKQKQMIFIGFDWKTIVETKKMFPENKCYWLSSKKEGLAEKIKEAAQIKLDGVDLVNDIIDEKTMQLAKQLNLDVIAWTVDNPDEMKRLINLGVKGITTNKPDLLKSMLQ